MLTTNLPRKVCANQADHQLKSDAGGRWFLEAIVGLPMERKNAVQKGAFGQNQWLGRGGAYGESLMLREEA
jgi:hypothetical protein